MTLDYINHMNQVIETVWVLGRTGQWPPSISCTSTLEQAASRAAARARASFNGSMAPCSTMHGPPYRSCTRWLSGLGGGR